MPRSVCASVGNGRGAVDRPNAVGWRCPAWLALLCPLLGIAAGACSILTLSPSITPELCRSTAPPSKPWRRTRRKPNWCALPVLPCPLSSAWVPRRRAAAPVAALRHTSPPRRQPSAPSSSAAHRRRRRSPPARSCSTPRSPARTSCLSTAGARRTRCGRWSERAGRPRARCEPGRVGGARAWLLAQWQRCAAGAGCTDLPGTCAA